MHNYWSLEGDEGVIFVDILETHVMKNDTDGTTAAIGGDAYTSLWAFDSTTNFIARPKWYNFVTPNYADSTWSDVTSDYMKDNIL